MCGAKRRAFYPTQQTRTVDFRTKSVFSHFSVGAHIVRPWVGDFGAGSTGFVGITVPYFAVSQKNTSRFARYIFLRGYFVYIG